MEVHDGDAKAVGRQRAATPCKEWKGSFYPERSAESMLAWYARAAATVEIKHTFYQMPKGHRAGTTGAGHSRDLSLAIKASAASPMKARLAADAAADRGGQPLQEPGRASAPSAGRCCFSCHPS